MTRFEGSVRPLTRDDRGWAAEMMERELGGRMQARQGELVDALSYEGFVAEADTGPAGLLTYRFDGDDCELVFIVALQRGNGIGSALVEALVAAAGSHRRIWLVTTNDNIDALAFYQRRGFRMIELRPGATDDARRNLKPQLPVVGQHGIPMRDEIELELPLR